MTPALWWSLAVTVLIVVAVCILVAMDNRRERDHRSKRKTIPPDLPPEGRWR